MFLCVLSYDSGRSFKVVELFFTPFVGLIIKGETASWKIYEVCWDLSEQKFLCKTEILY